MSKNSPIGIFDSGLGGLTVAKQIVKLLPREDIIYLGDTARVPYGPRSPEIIKRFSEENTQFLISKKVKCIVIACNTSSAVASDYLKRKFRKTPIFEVINPAAKEATGMGNKIGVIGTRATIASHAYEKDINKYSKSAKVISLACPLFVPFIEEGEIKSDGLKEVAREYLTKLKIKKIDTLVMGCTHYPIIGKLIAREVDNHVRIVDPGKSVAKEVFDFLSKNKMLNEQKTSGKKNFFVTDLTERFTKVAEMFLGQKIKGKILEVNL
ncbi:MAG: glutamate racemase [Candidatus Woesebacteria bacterium]|nr:MAG: glutamate racemase [Candidatus Woesebacteria bacterium]